MSEQKIFNPGNHREAWQRAKLGEPVTIVDDRGWEKQIEFSNDVFPKIWVANGELLPIPKDVKFVDDLIPQDQTFRTHEVEESGAVQPS